MAREPESSRPIKVAVLGGGTASLTVALALTDPRRRRKYDVTVYQMGWRLGGKGASGRNADKGQRIEEHGIHVWFGFYENAFRIMRACYDELAASHTPHDPPRAISRCDNDAFIPHDDFVLNENVAEEKWVKWVMHMPTNGLLPGDGVALPARESPAYLRLAALQTALWPFELGMRQGESAVAFSDPVPGNATETELLRVIKDRARQRRESVMPPDQPPSVGDYLGQAMDLLALPDGELPFSGLALERADNAVVSARRLPLRLELLATTLRWARDVAKVVAAVAPVDSLPHRYYLTLDTFAAIVAGISRDIYRDGRILADLDELDLRDWLLQHGADPRFIKTNPSVRFVYNSAFSFEGGDHTRPRIAAGAALKGILRVFMTGKGSLAFRMTSGMGDIVFGPLYEVLKKRGVKFEFFHRVDKLELRDDAHGKPSVARIQMTRQVKVRANQASAYHPLVNIKNLPSWPDRPLYDQIHNGGALAQAVAGGLNLEDPTARWDEQEDIVLESDRDFDQVVMGIPVAALKAICPALERHAEIGNRWRTMLNGVSTTATQAFQLWFHENLEHLHWAGRSPIFGTYVDPIDTYVDMTPALVREERLGRPIKSLAYFCGVIDDQSRETWGDAQARATRNAIRHLTRRCDHIWPAAFQNGQFNWSLLADAGGDSDEERFASQYSRANVLPSERYTLALPGTTKLRLAPNESGCSNLWLAGDWTANPINLGCVEATVMSGLLAARAMTGETIEIIGEDDDFIWRGIGLPPPVPVADPARHAATPAAALGAPVPRLFTPPGWEDSVVGELEQYFRAFDHQAVAELCERLIRHVRHSDEIFPERQAKQVLSLLRRRRCLDLLLTVADALIQSGQDAPQMRRQYAQALIDQGAYMAAQSVLDAVKIDPRCDETERAEARGLVGRIHKQRFVGAGALGGRQREQALRAAIAAYGDVYRLAPATNLWHGVNLLALLARARREGFDTSTLPHPRDLATEILTTIKNKRGAGRIDAWDCATATEACVALGEYRQAFDWLREYLDSPVAEAFELTSTLRQLVEVWQLDVDSEPGRTLLPMLYEHLLRRDGGRVQVDAREVRSVSVPRPPFGPWLADLESQLGLDEMRTYAWFRTGLDRCRLVGRVEKVAGHGHGTCFLVRAGDFTPASPGQDPDELLLLTCNHVLANPPTAPGSLSPREAVVKFEALDMTATGAREFRVESILWQSPVYELDATLARLSPRVRDVVGDVKAYPMAGEPPNANRRQRVYVIGHPLGGPLSYSLDDNLLLSVEDPLLVYRAPTEHGSSGSPVFNDQWELVGIHRCGGDGESRDGGRALRTRAGNEGIWIEAIRRRCTAVHPTSPSAPD